MLGECHAPVAFLHEAFIAAPAQNTSAVSQGYVAGGAFPKVPLCFLHRHDCSIIGGLSCAMLASARSRLATAKPKLSGGSP